jgi:uncharacterized protein
MLYQKIKSDLTDAQRSRDAFRVSVLRLIINELSYVQVDSRGAELGDEVVVSVLRKEVKKRQDAAESYKAVGHPERADEELLEAKLIESYLPVLMSEEEIRSEIAKIKSETGLEAGPLVGMVMSRLKGKADGSLVARLVAGS